MGAQGWYVDPFDRAARRWFSAGVPTALVADDDGVTASDPPPGPWDGPLTEIPGDAAPATGEAPGDEPAVPSGWDAVRGFGAYFPHGGA